MLTQVIIRKRKTDGQTPDGRTHRHYHPEMENGRTTDGWTDRYTDRHTDIQRGIIIPCHYRMAGCKKGTHFLCFMSNITVLRKLFEKKKEKKQQKKKNGELHSTAIDIGICGVNLRPPILSIFAELFFAC